MVAAVASGQAFSTRGEARSSSPALQGVAELLKHERGAALLGAALLAAHPEEAHLDVLVARLGLSIDSLPTPGSPELGMAASAIYVRHVADFRDGRLFELEGWQLSLTELRLSAIVSLTIGA